MLGESTVSMEVEIAHPRRTTPYNSAVASRDGNEESSESSVCLGQISVSGERNDGR